MRDLSPGWATNLAVLKHTGSVVEDHGDHLVVRTPGNPDFHWGNCVFVMDENAVDDARRWVEVFQANFPAAQWVAIGLTRMPADLNAWAEQGLDVELDDVLATSTRPRQTLLLAGYTARSLSGDDWEQYVLRALEENRRSGKEEPSAYERFMRARTLTLRSLCDRDIASFFGAFADGALVADLGIVRCGPAARYQSVGTDEGHRGRGLASHLLGRAARWAGERGCRQWVIVTEATNPAGRLYRSLGFESNTGNAEAYRPPPRE